MQCCLKCYAPARRFEHDGKDEALVPCKVGQRFVGVRVVDAHVPIVCTANNLCVPCV